ncbi:MAG TPA: HNH endonuclease signature motif containing protein [Acidobacteriaceae bacterium]
MTKTEYREYISGEAWRNRRKDFLKDVDYCERCESPRKLVILVYDQDLHVLHRSYARIGNEHPDDLEALCRRCHEIEISGRSELRKIEPFANCAHCKKPVWDFGCEHGVEALCADCTLMLYGITPNTITSEGLQPNGEGGLEPGMAFWKRAIRDILWMIHKDDVRKVVDISIDCLERNDRDSWWNAMQDIPSREGFVRRNYEKYRGNTNASTLEESETEHQPISPVVH